MEKMISALEKQPLGFNQWLAESRLSKRYFVLFRRELLRLGIVQHDPVSRKYSLSQDGKKTLWALSTSDFLRLHPPTAFRLSHGIEGPWIQELGAHLMEVDYAHSASLSHDRPIGDVAAIFEKRMSDAPKVFLRDLLGLAVERGLLTKAQADLSNMRKISRRKWREIFEKLCPRAHEIIYLERIDLKDLQRCLTHPKFHESTGLSAEVTPV
jgi:hypothetical protein